MWDIAPIEAIARPELAKAVTINPPPENVQRPISVWVGIDAKRMQKDFWNAIEARLSNMSNK